jgi:hypothetical protein
MALISSPLFAQGLTIGSGTVFSLGGATLSLSGNWSNSGTFNPENGTIIFSGTGTQTITNASGETFGNLTVTKASGDVRLANNITVNGNLTLTSGDLDINGKSISLGSSALVSETPGNTVKGSGTITGTVTLNAPSSVNLFGLGAIVTSAGNLGSTTITRGHAAQFGGGDSSILRYYDISPANNSGLNATLVFMYDESELNGKTESDLTLFRSTDNGATWTGMGGTVNVSANTVTLAGVNSFSRWTLGGVSNPLPVELVSFTAIARRLNVELRWKAATEMNNYGFEIERAEVRSEKSEISWNNVGFVEGNGTTNAPKQYSFTDKNLISGKYSYRLKQIDRDGKFKYSQEVEVVVGSALKVFMLEQNYPNPFNPTTTIGFTLQESGMTTLKIYDAIGREVATLVNENLEAGVYHQRTFDASPLASGIYIARLLAHGQTQIRKIVLLR